ncbi:MAG: prephenate dehydrogenase/arogenate dehydrogenase family protein [Candidatus Omnitrophica bacterium]|nr:prephenate dehydrogenase/arogenate dehydrogenase family protein [Candidatus Omnitrophota bacterium]
MKLFKKVAIIGTGLIGGSLGLAIKKHGLAGRVVGVSRHKQSLVLAKGKGAIDQGSLSLDIVKGADLLVLSAGVDTIISLAKRISTLVKKNCIVIDVASSKEKIVSSLERIFPNFVGTHPLAGSEKRGIANASLTLFKDSLCIVTPTKKTQETALRKVKTMWNKINVKTVSLSPKEHDQALAFTSHLPHAVAFSLINSIPNKNFKFASGGLKDVTRIAASDSRIWLEIIFSNRKNILKAIKSFKVELNKIESAIQRKDKASLLKVLKSAKSKRENLG